MEKNEKALETEEGISDIPLPKHQSQCKQMTEQHAERSSVSYSFPDTPARWWLWQTRDQHIPHTHQMLTLTRSLTPELMLLSHPSQTRSCPVLLLLKVWVRAQGRCFQYRMKAQVLFSPVLQAEVTAQRWCRYCCHWQGMDCSNMGPITGVASLFPHLPLSPRVVIFLTVNVLLTTCDLTYITNHMFVFSSD